MQDEWRPPAMAHGIRHVTQSIISGSAEVEWQLSFIGSGWSWIILVVASDWRFIGGFMVLSLERLDL